VTTQPVHGVVKLVAEFGGVVYPLGAGVIEVMPGKRDYRHCRNLATLLHQIAWQYEEYANEQERVGGPATPITKPRKVTTELGDTWWEIEPDRFVDADTWIEAYQRLKDDPVFATTLDNLKHMYPNSLVEEIP